MQRTTSRRAAFTLIELLVVIAIIAILAALLMGGVMAIFRKGPDITARNDIMQLSEGVQRFYGDYKFYPPDRIKLCSNFAQFNPAIPLDAISLQYISAMWPQLTPTTFVNINWAGTGSPGMWTLEGDQCLVFFLGGIPNGINPPQGFSTNPTNPAQAGGDRKKYLDFPAGRLVSRTGGPFPSYLDAYKLQPYAYLSSYKKMDGYGPSTTWWAATPNTMGISPYVQSAATATVPVKYWNSSTFQLICAGPDGKFGPGGVVWPSPTPATFSAFGKDDVSNFTDVKLGTTP